MADTMMIKHLFFLCCSAVLASNAAYAKNTSGNLNVSTSVVANCSVPSPSGNLVLPFDGSAALDGQRAGTEITVTIVCTGAPVLQSITFGEGAVKAANANHRILKSQDGRKSLGYKLYVKASGSGAADDESNEAKLVNALPDATSSIAINGMSFTVHINGRIFHTNKGADISDGESGYSRSGDVPSGAFGDTVTMTVIYR